jgi:hypothetical protein
MVLPAILTGGNLKIILLAFLAVAGGLFYWHYTVVVGERNAALTQVGALKISNSVQQQTISTFESALKDWKKREEAFKLTLDKMIIEQTKANEQTRRLNDVFAKHDLERLSIAKPVLVENRINSGTADVFRMFERSTGRDADDTR